MKQGRNVIAEMGTPPFFRVANAAALDLAPPPLRHGDALRTHGRSLDGFQKEALIASARSCTVWRLVSDEGAYLDGHDAAPCPLAFFTAGMVASYHAEITALAARMGLKLRQLRLIQNNFYTMRGSMRHRTMEGGALPVDLEVQVACDLDDAALHEMLSNAIHAAPVNGLLRRRLASLFSLTRNGRVLSPGSARPPTGPVVAEPGGAAPVPAPDGPDLVECLGPSPEKAVEKGTAGAATSLADAQDRTLNLAAICTRREDGIIEIEQHLYSPHGSAFRFLSEAPAAAGGRGRAPDPATLVSAGIGFCFMTQFGRMASMERLDLPRHAIVQDTHFSLGGASGGTGQAGEADPVETHVHLTTPESDDVARDMLAVAERTCFLHALCRTELKTRLRVTRL